MSLRRLLLRAAWVRALSNGGAPPYPTIAENRVFDSRIGDLADFANRPILPMIAVYTDADEREQREKGDALGSFNRTIDVALEIAIGTWNAKNKSFGLPQTDAELEALLDIMEAQIFRAIYSPTPAASSLLKLIKSVDAWDSIPGRTADGNNKISARKITIRCCVNDDCRPIIAEREPPFDAPAEIAAQAPYLNDLLEEIEELPALASIKEMFDAMKNPQPPAGQGVLEKVGVKVDLVRHETGQPDGVPDIEAEWQMPGDE